MHIITIARYIDQPAILSKLHSKMPAVLGCTGVGVWGYESFHKTDRKNYNGEKNFERYNTARAPKKSEIYSYDKKSARANLNKPDNKYKAFKNAITIGATVGASLGAARGLKIGDKTVFKGLLEYTPLETVLKKQSKAIENFLNNDKNVLPDKLTQTLRNAKNRTFTLKDIETISKYLPENKASKTFLQEILPSPENLNSKEIFSEIKRLSLIGLIPVAGGVAGGITADYITGTNNKKNTANKVKEGIYQYLANIFLCNVGAGAALWGSERLVKANIIKPLTPVKKLGVILSGITATGIIGGSYIANYISKKFINPLFSQKQNKKENLYSERKPEPLDIALHADDIATAGVLSGFKWIEPALPIMYFISGYRAGIGYRNNGLNNQFDKNC